MEFNLLFYLVGILFLFAPGLAINTWLGKATSIQKNFLIAFAGSYTLYALLLSFANYFRISSVIFNNAYLVLTLASIISICFKLTQKKANWIPWKIDPSQLKTLIDLSLILITISIYHFVVGAYDQLPADVYSHLTRYQFALQEQLSGTLGTPQSLDSLFMQKANIWYHLVASLTFFNPTPTSAVLFNITLLSKTIYLLAVYCFSRVIFQNFSRTRLLSLVATLLIALHFGVNVFSYLRYYSFAPTMFAFVIFLTGLTIVSNSVKENQTKLSLKQWLSLSAFTMALLSIHMQEAIFLILYIFLIALVNIGACIKNKKQLGKQDLILLILGLTSFFCLYIYTHNNLERHPNLGLSLWEFGGISTDDKYRFAILNPKYQFMQVVTLWGLIVYATSSIFYKQIYKHPVLLAGTLIPIVTVFNPLFVDTFIRLYSNTTLYRMLYAIPLHFIAAICLVNLSIVAIRGSTRFQKLVCIPLLMSLIALPLITFNKPNIFNSSRLWSLKKVPKEQGIDRFSEILPFLTSIENTQVITDPILGYYIGAMSKHRYFRKNLYINHLPFTFERYSVGSLDKYIGKLLVINRKPLSVSDVGRVSGHWHSNIMNPDKYYPQLLVDHLQKHPKKYQLLWSNSAKDLLIFNIN